jgi:hypothetical protein
MQEREAEGVKLGSIVEVGRAAARPRESDRGIAAVARMGGGIYQPAIHLSTVNEMENVPGGDPVEYVRAHVRRLEALRRAGIVERIDAETWRIPENYLDKARGYDTQRAKQLGVHVLSVIDVESQVTANGATWLDKELISSHRTPMSESGFGAEARQAMGRRQDWLIEQGLMQREAGMIVFRANLLATLARREIAAKGQELAVARGTSFHMPQDGERITGRYKGAVDLVSGKYALIERSWDFTLVPWRPVIERDLDRTISGIVRGDGISWQIGRSRDLGIGI